MNAFFEHHKDSIRFGYRCFDRLLLNGLIQPFQQPERVVGFFNFYREQYPVSRDVLRDIAGQFQHWVVNRSQKWGAPILEAPESRRDEFVKPYFRKAKANEVVAIVKGREPARIMIAIGNKKDDRWHLQIAQRWVVQYNFYVNDERWGPMFVRMCPYLPFSARLCLNQHHWLAQRMRDEGIDFQQCTNAFLRCANPARLQELSDSLTPRDLLTCGQKWLATFTPFFTERERKQAGCQHRLFFAQVEYCDNLVFRRRAALDQMGERLLDANRTIGQPNKITVIFGRRVTKQYRGKLQTVIEDLDLPNPVIRSHYGNGFLKQYVRDHVLLRTEPASNNVADYGVKKAVENLPQLRKKISAVIDNYHNVQQDILETFIDRGQLRKLAQPTVMPNGKRIPGLKLDHPRQLALMHALVRFSHIAAQSTFTTAEIYADTLTALEASPKQYTLASLRYDLSKLRAKGLVEKVPKSRRYRLLPEGYSICLVFLKLFERIYAPLTAGLLQPFAGDSKLQQAKRSQLDRLYQRVVDDLNKLIVAVGLKAA
ncbi:MAG: hypothetical protein IT161_13615 [Bryobacterales bacterium]|nr:hypothetical protein [Bryobacterales bacterium]MCZ2149125.1 hypothetical protein [Bryobacterales bacterium]